MRMGSGLDVIKHLELLVVLGWDQLSTSLCPVNCGLTSLVAAHGQSLTPWSAEYWVQGERGSKQ